MEVKIEKFDHFGNGIGKKDDKIIFVKKALPNEKVDVVINKEKKHYNFGEINKIISKSEERIRSICPYYNECGGCNFLHTTSEIENEFKISKGKDVIGRTPLFFDTKNINYRNKVIFHVEGNKIGFYKENSNDIVDIEYCCLLDKKINDVLNLLRSYISNNKHSIKQVMIRVGNEIMLSLTGKVNNDIINSFDIVDTILINDNIVKGKGFIEKNILDYKFKISPKSFFQVNYNGLECIFNILKDNLRNKYNKALDLYSGTSVMGILISNFCNEVISVECNKDATDDALVNIKNNAIINIKVINDKVENVIDSLKDIDLIIVDPPRSGLDKKTILNIKEINPSKIVYISCDMITLKRDLTNLKELYDIDSFYLVNMFPKTYHVESIIFLSHK